MTAIDLMSKLLVYIPQNRLTGILIECIEWCLAAQVLNHPFFDELKEQETRLENGNRLPDLFNFNETEMKIDSKFIKEHLIPDWYHSKN